MISQALVGAVPVRNAFDRAVLVAHSTLLEHGFVCLGTAEPTADSAASVSVGADGSASLQILPPGWNAAADSYTFGYSHPVRGAAESFTVKALVVGSSLVIHAASSVSGAALLTVTFNIAAETEVSQSDIKDWQEKVTSGIVLQLLARQPSTARLGKALDPSEPSPNATNAESGNQGKRPAPEGEPRQPRPFRGDPDGPDRPFFPRDPFDPFVPGFRPDWTPYGGLLGPRHPAWGQGVPVGGTGGMMPRFSPIHGPGGGEPDADHLRVPGRGGLLADPDGVFTPQGFPSFQGGATGLGRGRGGFDII